MMTHLKIKSFAQLGTDLVYDLLALRGSVFVVEQASACLDADGQDKTAWHVLIFDELDHLQAAARVLPPKEDPGHVAIGRVVVAPAYRGRGLGKELMRAAIELCEKQFPERPIRLSAQRHLASFYGSLGFSQQSKPYREDGIWHVQMIRHPGGKATPPSETKRSPWQLHMPRMGTLAVETPQRLILFEDGTEPGRRLVKERPRDFGSLPDKPRMVLAASGRRSSLELDRLHETGFMQNAQGYVGLEERGEMCLPPGFHGVTARDTLFFDSVRIDCSGSTGEGVSFLIELPEGLMYHAGGLILHEDTASCRKVFAAELKWLRQSLKGIDRPLDLAFLPTGDGRAEDTIRTGTLQMIDRLRPQKVVWLPSKLTQPEMERFKREITRRPARPGTWIPQLCQLPEDGSCLSLDLSSEDRLLF